MFTPWLQGDLPPRGVCGKGPPAAPHPLTPPPTGQGASSAVSAPARSVMGSADTAHSEARLGGRGSCPGSWSRGAGLPWRGPGPTPCRRRPPAPSPISLPPTCGAPRPRASCRDLTSSPAGNWEEKQEKEEMRTKQAALRRAAPQFLKCNSISPKAPGGQGLLSHPLPT